MMAITAAPRFNSFRQDPSMELKDCTVRREDAGRALNEQLHRHDGGRVANSMADGITTLRNLLFNRIHEDVESKIGADSMLMPLSPAKSETAAKVEIELFSIAESTCVAHARGYAQDRDWYLRWLAQLRLGDHAANTQAQRRLNRYLQEGDDQRRLLFSTYLERSYPEAHRAPLVLYRLFPLAVGIVTAVAFGRPLEANEMRSQQAFWLPSIQDCHECHGAPLDNGEKCYVCGNPVWTYRWLTVAD
jgi:hypothetical protein